MNADIANEVGKIVALVVKLGWPWHTTYQGNGFLYVDHSHNEFGRVNTVKTRKADRIPALRRLADRLRAELKARDRK